MDVTGTALCICMHSMFSGSPTHAKAPATFLVQDLFITRPRIAVVVVPHHRVRLHAAAIPEDVL